MSDSQLSLPAARAWKESNRLKNIQAKFEEQESQSVLRSELEESIQLLHDNLQGSLPIPENTANGELIDYQKLTKILHQHLQQSVKTPQNA
ncbi:MAG: hypothetical protein HN790_05695 [Methylococcales bacterium]|jgi:hypothetical protein|nr:hypothetical protein [Methylococcales bacterium]